MRLRRKTALKKVLLTTAWHKNPLEKAKAHLRFVHSPTNQFESKSKPTSNPRMTRMDFPFILFNLSEFKNEFQDNKILAWKKCAGGQQYTAGESVTIVAIFVDILVVIDEVVKNVEECELNKR